MLLQHPPTPSISTPKHRAFLTLESVSSTPTSGKHSSKCSYLELQLNIDPSTVPNFESQVCRDFAGPSPYPPICHDPTVPTHRSPEACHLARMPCQCLCPVHMIP